MKIQSSWKIEDIVKRTPLRQVYGRNDFYVPKSIAKAADGDGDFYDKSVRSAENGKSFDISLRDKDGASYPFAVKSFELYSFADKKNYLLTVLDIDADDFINFLAKPYSPSSGQISLHSDKWRDGKFHARHDYKSDGKNTVKVIVKLVVVLLLLVLIAFIQKLR